MKLTASTTQHIFFLQASFFDGFHSSSCVCFPAKKSRGNSGPQVVRKPLKRTVTEADFQPQRIARLAQSVEHTPAAAASSQSDPGQVRGVAFISLVGLWAWVAKLGTSWNDLCCKCWAKKRFAMSEQIRFCSNESSLQAWTHWGLSQAVPHAVQM